MSISVLCTHTCNMVLLHGEIPLQSLLKRFNCNKTILSQVITKFSFNKTKLNPLYQKLNLFELINIFKQEILKFMYKYQNKSLPKCVFECDFQIIYDFKFMFMYEILKFIKFMILNFWYKYQNKS